MTINELFESVNLTPLGPVGWQEEIPDNNSKGGVYVVALVDDANSHRLIHFEPESAYERKRWIPNEPIIYIGQTTKQTIAKRVRQYHRHRYGSKSPHRGGQAIKLLLEPIMTPPHNLWVYWAPTDRPTTAEDRMLSEFERHTGHQPYANRKKSRLRSNLKGH
jgi:hypothetical protein